MTDPVAPPIVTSSTFSFEDTAQVLAAIRGEGHIYSRWSNPTVEAAEAVVRDLTGAEQALAFGSGMAAIASALLCATEEVPRLLCQATVYGGTFELARDLFPRFGIDVTFFELDEWEAALKVDGPVGAVFAESPTNPTLRVIDLGGLARATHDLGAKLVVDNTFATPINQKPLALGADVEVHSATKYLGGHHDLIAGVVAGSEPFCKRLWNYRKLLGGILDAFPAYLLHRGLKTLDLRVGRQNETALRLAEHLEAHPGVSRVHYPGLESHPDHGLAREQMTGWGGMLAFEVTAGYEAAVTLSDSLKTIILAPSLGGTETLVTVPRTSSHVNLSADELARAGIAEGLVRLSVGLEPFEHLRDDLDQALGKL